MKPINKINGYIKRLAFLSVAAVLFSSCLKNLSNDNEPQNVAALNVVNASPGPMSINYFLDNNLVNTPSLQYGQKSGYILAVARVRQFDAARGGTLTSIFADTIELTTDKYYSLFLTGENTTLSSLFIEDELTTPEVGKSKIRFINLSPDAGTLRLSLSDPNIIFNGQSYKGASAFQEIDPASYELKLKNSDGTEIDQDNLDVAAGKIYTIWAGGLVEGDENTSLRLMTSINN